MKTTYKMGILGLCFLCFEVTLVEGQKYAEFSASAKLVVEIERSSGEIIIDGLLDDWAGVRRLGFEPGGDYISTEEVYDLQNDGAVEPEGTAGTAADLAGEFSLLWDEKRIYLAAWVRDNVHDVRGGDDFKWWLKDSVSLFLDVPLDGEGYAWKPGDHAFSFVADPALPGNGRWWRHGDAAGQQEVPAPPEVVMGVQVGAGGYTLEAAIPMALLSTLTPEWQVPFAGRKMGFMFIVTDPDGGPDPFGGELIYGGDNDNDRYWAQLRLVETGAGKAPHLESPRHNQLLKDLVVPSGFSANLYALVPNGPNRMAFGPEGRLYVTVGGWGRGGELWVLEDLDGDGMAERHEVLLSDLDTPIGLAFHGADLYVAHRRLGRGRISLYRDADGDDRVDLVEHIIQGLSAGHGVGNIVAGPDGKLYVGQGSRGDLEVGPSPLDATIFCLDPKGENVEVVATGLRNAYGFEFDRQGRLFATDNGPNQLDVPYHDELNYIVSGRDYGFPKVYLNPEDTEGLAPPIWRFAENASANGMAFYTGSVFPREYRDDAFVALWGPADPNVVDLANDPRPPWDAYYVARVELADTVVTRVSRFAGDFQHPVDVRTGPDGALYVADWGSTGPGGAQNKAAGDGAIYRIVYDAAATAVEELGRSDLPVDFRLSAAPNPFNASTLISFSLPADGHVALRIYNLQGQLIRSLSQGWRRAGSHRAEWDGRDGEGRALGSGVYLVQLKADGGAQQTWKSILLR